MKNKILGRMFWFYQVWVNKLMLRLSEHNMASQGYTMRVSQNKTEQHNTTNKTTVFGIHTTKLSCKRNYFNKNTTGEESLPNL